jgi:hypothetical protein
MSLNSRESVFRPRRAKDYFKMDGSASPEVYKLCRIAVEPGTAIA